MDQGVASFLSRSRNMGCRLQRPGSRGCDTAPEEETRGQSDSTICQTEEGVSSSTTVGAPVVATHPAALRRPQRDGESLARQSSVIPERGSCQDRNRRCGDRDPRRVAVVGNRRPRRGLSESALGSEGFFFQWSILGEKTADAESLHLLPPRKAQALNPETIV